MSGATTAPAVPTNADIYVLGGDAVGVSVARRLEAEDHAVTLIDDSLVVSDIPTHQVDPTDVRSLTEAGLETASTVIVAGPSDAQNLLAAQLVQVTSDVDHPFVLTNHPDRLQMVADGGHISSLATTALSNALVDSL